MSYLAAFDPGRAKTPTIGFCIFDEKGIEVERGALTWDELVSSLGHSDADSGGWQTPYSYAFFRGYLIEAIVVEDFVNDPRRTARGGQRNGASEVIGALEYVANKADSVLFVRQRPGILEPAAMHTGYTIPINPRTKKPLSHMPHQDAAYLHGYYYLESVGILEPKPLD